MRLDKVERKLGRGRPDEGVLRSLALEVGHELPHGRLPVLTRFRELLACAEPSEHRSWEEGYRTALLDVIASWSAELGAQQEERQAQLLLQRRGWKEVLLVLSKGPHTQSQLAEALRMDKGQLSHLLKEMRATGLVEVFQAPEGKKSSQPHHLTLRGQLLLKTVQPADTLSEDVAQALRFAVDFFACRLVAGRLGASTPARQQPGEGLLRQQAEELLVKEGQRLGLLPEDKAMVQVVESPESTILDRLLEREPEEVQQVWAELFRPLPEQPILLRSSRISRWKGPMLDAMAENSRLEGSRTLVDPDVDDGLFEVPDFPYVLVYESPALHALDRARHAPWVERLERRAHGRFYLSADPETVLEGYKRIGLEQYISPRLEERRAA